MSIISNKIKAKIKMIEMGIVPAFTGHELTKMLDTLSNNERRIAKRKFRKAWRKILKNNPQDSDRLISNNGIPTNHHLRNRACIVISSIMRDVI